MQMYDREMNNSSNLTDSYNSMGVRNVSCNMSIPGGDYPYNINCSNFSISGPPPLPREPSVHGLLAFGFLLTFLLMLVIVLILATLVPVAATKALPTALRFLLSSQLLGSLVAAAAGFVIGLTGLVLVFTGREGGNIPFCAFLTFVYSVGAVVRMWSMTAYSIVILLIIVYTRSKVKTLYIVVTIVAIWFLSCCLNAYALVPPPVYALHYVDGTACFPNYNGVAPGIRYGLSAMWIIVGGLIPVCISVVIPIICYCYLKSKSITESSDYKKAMVRFALFLVIGNTINLIGTVVTAIAALYVEGNEFYIAYSLVVLSLIPTPILILIFLKPVRERLGMYLMCPCSCNQKRVSYLKKSITSSALPEVTKDTTIRLSSVS